MTSFIQESKYITKLPIKIKIQELRLTKDQQNLDWNNPDRLDEVSIIGAVHLVKATIKACKKIYKSNVRKDLSNWPGDISAEFFPWYADRDSPNLDKDQKHHTKIAIYKEKHWTQKIVQILLNTVQDLNLPIDYKDDVVTLHQALACCRSSGMANYLLFPSISYVQRTGKFVAVCHSDYEEEAQSVINNLISLCHEHFGKEVKIWFKAEAWCDNAHCTYNW